MLNAIFTNKAKFHTHTISIQHRTEDPHCCRKLRGKKSIQTGKEVKLYLFADGLITYIRNSKKFIKLFELISECEIF